MTNKEVSCIVANVCFVGAILSTDTITWLLLTILGIAWLISFVVEVKRERFVLMMKAEILHRKHYNEFIKACQEASIKGFKKDGRLRKK